MYKFSIVIPNYNKEKYIRRCLNSIFTQSIKKQNYIYIVCMISIMIRAFTDHVFWPAYGTPILFYFMFYYDNISSNLNLCKRRQEFLK